MTAAPPVIEASSTPFSTRMGTTVHCSPLLHRMRAAGLDTPAKLAATAISRGLAHYAPADGKTEPPPLLRPVGSADLAIALMHPSFPWDPQRIRLGAAILATRGLDPKAVAHLAIQERAIAIVREIAASAAVVEPEDAFWRELLGALPAGPSVPPGLLPHRSRYMAISGLARPGCAPQSVWIRPSPAA